MNKFNIILGPAQDRRNFQLELPIFPTKLGVLVSGGLDSAILFYLLKTINQKIGNVHTIIPYSIRRKEGSIIHAPLVIDYIHKCFNEEPTKISFIDTLSSIREGKQVWLATQIIKTTNEVDHLYLGVIYSRPDHFKDVEVFRPTKKEIGFLKYPFFQLEKSHIIDLIINLNQQKLFEITTSCDNYGIKCFGCVGCTERAWGFSEMGVPDYNNDSNCSKEQVL